MPRRLALVLEETRAERVLARYIKRVDKLLRRGEQLTEADVRRIRGLFRTFRAEALARLPELGRMNRTAIAGVLGSLDAQLRVVVDQYLDIVEAGTHAQLDLARRVTQLYGQTFLGELDLERALNSFSGVRLRALDAVSGLSADLIGLNSGGLRADVLAAVNRTLKLAALGAGEGGFAGAVAVERALSGTATWSARAERIYRTETLRAHSIVTEQMVRELDRYSPTAKQWRWSGIQRPEHERINGQTVDADARFTVPLRDGGTVELLYPRDPVGPPDAVIACGCYVVPTPKAA